MGEVLTLRTISQVERTSIWTVDLMWRLECSAIRPGTVVLMSLSYTYSYVLPVSYPNLADDALTVHFNNNNIYTRSVNVENMPYEWCATLVNLKRLCMNDEQSGHVATFRTSKGRKPCSTRRYWMTLKGDIIREKNGKRSSLALILSLKTNDSYFCCMLSVGGESERCFSLKKITRRSLTRWIKVYLHVFSCLATASMLLIWGKLILNGYCMMRLV